MLNEQQEHALVRRLRDRDARAFAECVGLYQHQVFDLVFRMLGSRDEADDVAQEVFVAVSTRAATLGGERRLSTWIYQICTEHCRARIKRTAANGGPERDVARGRGAESPGAEAAAQQAILDLDDEQRAVIVLRDVKNLSTREIAEITGLAEDAVKARLHRARFAMAEKLKAVI
jgi:RNA polymerase sigma-70 factor (ECF subfamily)